MEQTMEKVHNYTYIVRCSDGSYYTGWTNNLEKRMKEHNEGRKGAKYTRGRRPVVLVYSEEFDTPEVTLAPDTNNTLSTTNEYIQTDDNTVDAVLFS